MVGSTEKWALGGDWVPVECVSPNLSIKVMQDLPVFKSLHGIETWTLDRDPQESVHWEQEPAEEEETASSHNPSPS